ncbi:Transcription factor IIIB 60 kDa subunit [Colletotrichum gloeosporioides]|uniref:Brf1-like TBP-binding domain-containing protein n=2 Tax=Colletotrichum gloeosporioides TaxID=474922 RepID=T0KKQ1_COLGC|nr:Transcription factor IIIB 60 kDa subunit [Colletotrichum siamense]XP_037174956.1 Transcription factor IIIB 60 kDa subunit [Colletotrichum aenigma]XP_045264319.1 Transcription factor IIIB 60 kDa subunit [Colletotrichum gloeosporioides]EQB56172.1 Brf1-like TBP-binding domain-containing protein [Colletotrichum gloeosporioides Cg-14]KAI8229764.1 Transcription factor IIIB 60 kDa subunit [Colletotrichum sp. SAR 10_96]KAI8259920.1 Transcription factor IIIB 60 kDa subunit [Colletotrichum sp. SAR11_
MSSFLTPTKKSQKPQTKSKPFQPPNRIRAIREQAERQQANAAAAAANAAAQAQLNRARPATVAVSKGPQCPNKACVKPNVVDGVCQTCGRVADDSNIVAEVQFGETSSGAAMVQGSYIAADQAGVRTLGPAFRRVGGSDDREKSIREARSLMQGYAHQLNLGENTVNTAVQIFKLASQANFVQGRTLVMVAAVCLYAACRTEKPCRIMLMDLADLTQLNVFKLGRAFKALNATVFIFDNGEGQVFPEDLIYRLASKLEFKHMTNRVAEDAIRLVQRMKQDWIVMGRRPSGICGACLLMAARMHNFRRTVREIVYLVKVTTHTIQERLTEFNVTDASKMTVEDFLAQDFSSNSHDPPSFYRNTESWQKKQEELGKKRKRAVTDDGENVRATPAPLPPPPDLSSAPAIEYRRDKDGYIIPPLPSKIQQDEPALRDANSKQHLETLAEEFGDATTTNEESSQAEPEAEKTTKAKPKLPINEAWEQDENEMEEQISEIMNDPETYEHAKAFSNAEQRARIHSIWALQQQPDKAVSMAPVVGEDEFADDPEVLNCCLTPEEIKIKELLWVNENKDWLRQSQERLFRKKLEGQKEKPTRKRKKRPRIGEGQTTPASTPGEAAVNVMKERGFSKRINYDAIRQMFDVPDRGDPGSRPESEAASRPTSKAPSVLDDPIADDESDHMGGSGDEMDDHQDDEFGGGDDYDDMGDESHMYDDDDQGMGEDEDEDDFGLNDDDE